MTINSLCWISHVIFFCISTPLSRLLLDWNVESDFKETPELIRNISVFEQLKDKSPTRTINNNRICTILINSPSQTNIARIAGKHTRAVQGQIQHVPQFLLD